MTFLPLLAYPKKEFSKWVTENGMGFTLLITPSLWMRDRVVEAYGLIPRFYADVTPELANTFGVRDMVRLVDVSQKQDDEENWEDSSL